MVLVALFEGCLGLRALMALRALGAVRALLFLVSRSIVLGLKGF